MRMILWVCHFLIKEKEKLVSSDPKNETKARRVLPADKGAAELLQSLPDIRMSVIQFGMLPAILEPHIKKTTTSFCKPTDREQQLTVCLR